MKQPKVLASIDDFDTIKAGDILQVKERGLMLVSKNSRGKFRLLLKRGNEFDIMCGNISKNSIQIEDGQLIIINYEGRPEKITQLGIDWTRHRDYRKELGKAGLE